MHDDTLNRTVRGPAENCTGRVDTKTLAQIKTCSAGEWFGAEWAGEKIPTLEEVFQKYGKTVNYYIETKTPAPEDDMEPKLLALLDKYDLRETRRARLAGADPVLQRRLAAKIHALDARLPLIFLGTLNAASIQSVREYGVGIGPSFGGVTKANVDAAHAACLNVHPYTVNTDADLRACSTSASTACSRTSRIASKRCSATRPRPASPARSSRPPTCAAAAASRRTSPATSAAPSPRRCR